MQSNCSLQIRHHLCSAERVLAEAVATFIEWLTVAFRLRRNPAKESAEMNILSLLTNHTHYWGIPHERPSDKRLIQTCYECGAEREIKVDLCPTSVPSDSELEFHKPKAA